MSRPTLGPSSALYIAPELSEQGVKLGVFMEVTFHVVTFWVMTDMCLGIKTAKMAAGHVGEVRRSWSQRTGRVVLL
jgi:hypothetical protein